MKVSNWTEPEVGTEKMPRISVDDFLDLLENNPDKVIVVDIRNNIQYVFFYNTLEVFSKLNV